MNKRVSEYSLSKLAKHFNADRSHTPRKQMTINQFNDAMKVLDKKVKAEMEAHRRHRKAKKEKEQADGE